MLPHSTTKSSPSGDESDLTVYYIADGKANDKDPLTVHFNMPHVREDTSSTVERGSRDAEIASGVYGLKALGVFSVLAFYTWPTNFRIAYLGADIYFVTCGYLMAVNFDKLTTAKFYSLQFCRILSTYAIFVFFALQIDAIFFGGLQYDKPDWNIAGAMTFMANVFSLFAKTDHLSAFREKPPALNIFMHTWLVSIEVQFCIFAPLILIFLRSYRDKSPSSHIQWRTFALTMLLSLGAEIFEYTQNSSAETLFARLWQFIAGAAAYHAANSSSTAADDFNYDYEKMALKSAIVSTRSDYSEGGEEKHFQDVDLFSVVGGKISSNANYSKCDQKAHSLAPQSHTGYYDMGASRIGSIYDSALAHLVLLSLVLVVLMLPFSFPGESSVVYKVSLQLFVVGATAFLLYCGTMPNVPSSSPTPTHKVPTALTNNLAIIVGDSAFVWYLCHWPLVLCKLQVSFIPQIPVYGGFIAFAFSLALAIVFRNTVDRRIQNIKDVWVNVGITLSVYLACIFSIVCNIYF